MANRSVKQIISVKLVRKRSVWRLRGLRQATNRIGWYCIQRARSVRIGLLRFDMRYSLAHGQRQLAGQVKVVSIGTVSIAGVANPTASLFGASRPWETSVEIRRANRR